MRRPLVLLPAGERRIAAEVFLGAATVCALLAGVFGMDALVMVGLGLFLAASLLVVIQAPIGSVPLGYALVIAIAVLEDPAVYFPVLGLALLCTVPVLEARYGQGDTARRVIRWSIAGLACGGAAHATRLLMPEPSPEATLVCVAVAGIVFLSLDLLVRDLLPTTTAPPVRLTRAWPVHASILCASGLLVLGYNREHWMALVAILPLVLTRFAFDRYAAAQQAYRQAIKALSIVPEVAGVTPLGHGERSAVYAAALAKRLGLGDDACERVATAARLHHIGYVTLDDPQEATRGTDLALLSRLGGDILRETRFLSEIGDLVESVHSDDPRLRTREGAILRVASNFDHLVLEDPARVDDALDTLAFAEMDAYDAAAVLALRWVLDEDPEVLKRAIASGAPLTEVGARIGDG